MDLKIDLLCLASHERGMSNNPTQNLAVQLVWKPGAKSLWKCTCHGQIFAHANGSLEIEIGEENTPFLPSRPASVNIAFDILAKQCSLSLLFGFFCLYGSQSRDCVRIYLPLCSSLLSSNLMFVSADLVDGQCYEVIQAIFMRQDMLSWDFRCYKTKPHHIFLMKFYYKTQE